MARGKKEKPEIRPIESIVNNPNDKAVLKNMLDEAARCKLRIADENTSIKDIRSAALDKIGLDPKLFGPLLAVVYNESYIEKRAEIETLDFAISSLIESK